MTVCPDGAKARLANHHLRGWCSHWALCCSSAEHASICPGYTLDSPPQLTLIEGIRETASSLKYPPPLPPSRHHHHHHQPLRPPAPGITVLPVATPADRPPTIPHLLLLLRLRLDQLHHRRRIIAMQAAYLMHHRCNAPLTSKIPPLSVHALIKQSLRGYETRPCGRTWKKTLSVREGEKRGVKRWWTRGERTRKSFRQPLEITGDDRIHNWRRDLAEENLRVKRICLDGLSYIYVYTNIYPKYNQRKFEATREGGKEGERVKEKRKCVSSLRQC